jgi:hypothetical protein
MRECPPLQLGPLHVLVMGTGLTKVLSGRIDGWNPQIHGELVVEPDHMPWYVRFRPRFRYRGPWRC